MYSYESDFYACITMHMSQNILNGRQYQLYIFNTFKFLSCAKGRHSALKESHNCGTTPDYTIQSHFTQCHIEYSH